MKRLIKTVALSTALLGLITDARAQQTSTYQRQNGEIGAYIADNNIQYKSINGEQTKTPLAYGIQVSTRLRQQLGMVLRYSTETTNFSELDVLMRYVFIGAQFREAYQESRYRLTYDNYFRMYGEAGAGRGRLGISSLDNLQASEIVADFYSYGGRLGMALNILDFWRVELAAGYFVLEAIFEENVVFAGNRREVSLGSTFVF